MEPTQVEGEVIFRNRMGRTTVIIIRDARGEDAALVFNAAQLGEDTYVSTKTIGLGEQLRALTQPSERVWRREIPYLDVLSFERAQQTDPVLPGTAGARAGL